MIIISSSTILDTQICARSLVGANRYARCCCTLNCYCLLASPQLFVQYWLLRGDPDNKCMADSRLALFGGRQLWPIVGSENGFRLCVKFTVNRSCNEDTMAEKRDERMTHIPSEEIYSAFWPKLPLRCTMRGTFDCDCQEDGIIGDREEGQNAEKDICCLLVKFQSSMTS